MRKLLLLIVFPIFTPLTLWVSFSLLISIAKQHTPNYISRISSRQITFAALPSTDGQITDDVQTSDMRVGKVKYFFYLYGSDLQSFAQTVVDMADKYNIDYRLVPAIAMLESKGCQYGVGDTYNCWGYGMYTNHVTSFPDYATAIETVSKYLSNLKQNKDISSPEEIAQVYDSVDPTGWTVKLNYFLNQL